MERNVFGDADSVWARDGMNAGDHHGKEEIPPFLLDDLRVTPMKSLC